ncbi:MAG: helix-turn-helix domain-containing protein [Lachnospiraceae bacterium]|nr:helix-turn-helix domain-containing protein [Lachnospiraceae bacterium]
MYKIMLADDEGIVIDSLKFIIQKEFGGECEVEFAKTGRNVIELAESFRPDIAVMDIQMPGINGIDAMREIRKTNEKVVFIVMSAYDKFDYAQEAMKLGSIEYITKPMERTKIVAALKKAMEIVSEEKNRRSNDLIIREKLETVVPILENGLIYNILFHEYFDEDIENYKTMLGIRSENAYMMVLVSGDAKEGNHMTNALGSSVKLQQHYKEIRELIKLFFNGIVGSVMGNKIAVLVPCEYEKMDYAERVRVITDAREMKRKLSHNTDIAFRVGIGKVNRLSRMDNSYRDAINALLITTNTIAHADDLPIGCDFKGEYPIELEMKLFEEIAKGRTEAALSAARDFFEWVKTKDIMDVRLKILEFAMRAETIAYENGLTYKIEDRRDYLNIIMQASDVESLWEWFRDRILFSVTSISETKTESVYDVVEASKAYIDANYTKNITLDDLSMAVNVSSYYLSRIFKENTGENFIDYLTRLRIERAKELLATTTYSMKEIGIMSGYSDPNYFSKTFKKNVGVTPTEYREGK